MSDPLSETIVAVATPPGRGGVGMVRISGPEATQIAFTIIGKVPQPRLATHATFVDGANQPIDRGIVLFFEGPASFTGEDVVELHGHGGPVPMDMLVNRCLSLGARLAEAGEFSKRAFLNDKIDLTQAEAISDLIESASTQAARAAVHSLQGDFAQRINALLIRLTELRMYVEAAIDFPEEEIDFLQDQALKNRLQHVESLFADLTTDATQGQLLRDGMVIVLTGQPNVGKSSLLNQLAGYDAAIVTSRAGTTRDVLREDIHIDGMPLRIIDTTGLRESDDPVEVEGIKRAEKAIASADHLLHITDDIHQDFELNAFVELPSGISITHVVNKIDLTQLEAGVKTEGERSKAFVSAKTGQGVNQLRQHLKNLMGYSAVDGGKIIARRRHLQALSTAQNHLVLGKKALLQDQAGEIMAEELRLAQNALSEITGRFTSDDLLGEIFSSFCIGK